MVLLDTGTPGTSREIYSEDADGETRTRNPSVIMTDLCSLNCHTCNDRKLFCELVSTCQLAASGFCGEEIRLNSEKFVKVKNSKQLKLKLRTVLSIV